MIVCSESLKLKKIAAALLCLALAVGLLGASGLAHAKGKRTVRVAFFPMDGYHTKDADGALGGMDVEYLDTLCRYADWEVEYVECANWDAALRLLSSRQVDLVGSAQYSAERASIYQYADLSSGYTFGTIATSGSSDLAYEDFEAMQDITFVMVQTYVRRAEFLQYLSDNGIPSPKIREYPSTTELRAALDAGEIDAMVHTFMEIQEGQRLIGRFAPRPFYYITYPGNNDVARELNYAISDMKMDEPELESKLMTKYYSSRLDKTIVFTTAEKDYVANSGKLVAGYFDNLYPFLYTNEDGSWGLTKDLLEGAAAMSGLTLTWQKIDSLEAAHEALLNGEIDILSYCSHTPDDMTSDQLLKLKDYTVIPLVLVMEKDKEMADLKTLATVPYLSDQASDVVDLEVTDLISYGTQRECMEAVKKQKADAVLCDGYLAEYLLSSEMQYYNLEVKRALRLDHGVSLAVRSGDSQLAGILNKTLLTIDDRAVSDYMIEHNIHSLTSVGQVIQSNSALIITILLMIIFGVVLVAVQIIQDSKKIQKLMYKDVEVDIWNLNHLIYLGKRALTPERNRLPFAVAYLNICQFQRYKVVYGWSSGERLLESIADILLKCMQGEGESCAKADGDHFVLLMSAENGDILERLKNIGCLIEEYIYHATGNRIDIQMGVYFIPQDSDDVRGAVVCANQALDFIHQDSGEKIKVFDQALENAIKERHQKQRLLDSMNIDEHFTAYYQAKVDVRTEKIVGAEALVRLIDPTACGEVRSPGFFVPYYEQTGRVVEVDFFVLRCVCDMLRRRLDRGEAVVTVSCNFSRIHFTKPDFVERLVRVLDEYDIPKDLIEVEVTETLVMEEMQQKVAEQTMAELHAKGIRLSIDDFGSGYSSLGVIEKIPASVIKLDRSFLLNKEDRERQVKIMKRIVDLAEDLGAQIVCEGVETEADVELMREIGANVAQGYRYAKPAPEDEFERRLSENAQMMDAAG